MFLLLSKYCKYVSYGPIVAILTSLPYERLLNCATSFIMLTYRSGTSLVLSIVIILYVIVVQSDGFVHLVSSFTGTICGSFMSVIEAYSSHMNCKPDNNKHTNTGVSNINIVDRQLRLNIK